MSESEPSSSPAAVPRFRRLEITLGVIVLVAGLVYLLVGIPGYTASGSSYVEAGKALVVGVHFPFSPESQVTISLHWNASSTVSIEVRSCASDPSCTNPSATSIASGTGVSGSLQFAATKGNYYAVTPSDNATISYSGSTLFPYFYLALPAVVGGTILLLVGLFVKPRGRPAQGEGEESPELADLLKTVKDRGMVVALLCPSCNAPLKVTGEVTAEDLLSCTSCHEPLAPSDIRRMLSAALK